MITTVSMTSVPPKLSERAQKLNTDPAGWVLPQALFSGQRQAEGKAGWRALPQHFLEILYLGNKERQEYSLQ